MEYTPQEVAKLLANRPHQPHYVEWLLKQCIQHELAAERERWHDLLRECEQSLSDMAGPYWPARVKVLRRVQAALRALAVSRNQRPQLMEGNHATE